MNIKAAIKNLPIINKVNNEIKKYKYIHLMYNDKFNKPFVDFLNKNFDPKEHLILCKRWIKDEKVAPFPVGDNVYEIYSLFGLNFEQDNIKKIFCHSMTDKEIVYYLYKHDKTLKEKTYWIIWGRDLYEAPDNEKHNYVRTNIKGYIALVDGDCEKAQKRYNSSSLHYKAGYTFPIPYEAVKSVKRVPKDYIKIQVNNSCDDATLEMFDILSKFKDENIKISTILSYGKLEFKEEVLKKGKEIFGDKFEYVEKFIPPTEYPQFFSDNDVFVLNHNRQQGLGTTFLTLALGCKLFIKSEVTTYDHFMSKGIKVYDTNKIADMTFEEFIHYDEDAKAKNQELAMMFFDNKYLKDSWEAIFKDNR